MMTEDPSTSLSNELKPFDASSLINQSVEDGLMSVVEYAIGVKASDLFLLSNKGYVEIALKRHGAMDRLARVPFQHGRHMISFVKAAAGMDISEVRRPADGRWIIETDRLNVDARLNTVATMDGEDLSMRLWDRNEGLLGIDELGMTAHDYGLFTTMLAQTSGLILVTGPTATGKTTTLYAALNHLSDGSRKINTLENPVEYQLEYARQSQVNPKIGLDFPDLLRGVLRQSPDVVMIGEIRDEDTAKTAVRAANSGHLVLATMHAPVAAAAVQSIRALGVRSYFLSNCLLGVVAQRLVRKLCPKCRVPFDIGESPQTFDDIEEHLSEGQGNQIFGPGGCDECLGDGYFGRTGLYEVMTMSRELRLLLADSNSSTQQIEEAAVRHGMIEFRRNALLYVASGITSTEEILRDVPAEYLGLED